MRSRLAWALFALTCAFAVAQVTLLATSSRAMISPTTLSGGFPLATVAAVAGAGIGALIVSRYPRHRIGWLLVVGQFGTAFGLAAQAYGRFAITGELGNAPGSHLAVWLGILTSALFAVSMLAVLFLLAPDGHLLSRRWRWAMWTTVVGLLMYSAANASVSPSGFDENATLRDDPGLYFVVLELGGVLLVLVGLIASTVSLVERTRRASGEEAQQLRWIAAAAAGMAIGTFVAVVPLGLPTWVALLPLMLAYVCVQVFTGVAILRFRLYDLDLIVSRAIVLTVLSGFVAAGYVLVVVVISAIVDAPTEGTFWPSLLATALVAIGVQPLRRRVGQLADRVVYGARAAPYEALADFSKGLHETSATEDLLPQVAEAVCRSVGARQTQIWLDVPERAARPVCWPDRDEHRPDLAVPVREGADILGGLSVAMPPGRALRPTEEKLLRDFTVQLGRAFRSIRLESELADRVDQLADQANELSASRRRLLTAQAAGRHRFESAINRQVLPHLSGLPERLQGMGSAIPGRAWLDPDAINEMIADTHASLEALRALTRGVFPAQLVHRGLVTALSSQLVLAGLAGVLRADESATARRFHPRVESAVYFCAVEFLRELDPPEDVRLTVEDGLLVLAITGCGGTTAESRTRHLADRVATIGGTVRTAVVATMVTLLVEVPLDSDAGLFPDPLHAVGVEG